jgi:flagellar M-ring protein FliF
MAVEASNNPVSAFLKSPLGNNFALGAGMALVVGIMVSVWLWGQKPEYRVLLSNYSDSDGGAIVSALQQMEVPYQFSEGGGAILVPADRVHDARLQLASQGLPKATNVGFELMENQKMGVSQFLEQVNFQRALEGELARSINSISVVEASRVHLAIPKPSVFVREKQKPTASVLLNLHPGRSLEPEQVSAIIHLVSSSVPDLPIQNVTIVDQNGNLLSSQDDDLLKNRLDPNQLKYIQALQADIVRRIESILTPILGIENIKAEATADIDFSHSEQAAETFTPNNNPDKKVKRSEHSNESSSSEESASAPSKPGGVPGASSNQSGQSSSAASSPNSKNSQKENTVNYEVDKTVKYVQQPMGTIKRLTVAVLVNNRTEADADGKPITKPLSDAEKQQITDLVKEAMGFNQDRGDSLNVANTTFTITPKEVIPEEPFWKQFANLDTAKSVGQYLLSGLVILYLFFNVLRPMLKRLSMPPVPPPLAKDEEITTPAETKTEQNNLETAQKLAAEDPRMVANIVKNWVSE